MQNRLFLLLTIILSSVALQAMDTIHIRFNQMGYLPEESKTAILFSDSKISEKILLIYEKDESIAASLTPKRLKEKGWGTYKFYYTVDFSAVKSVGYYYLKSLKAESRSLSFKISARVYDNQADRLLGFMRQQRCGYNPFFGRHCHQQDGVSFYGPMPDSTVVDARGGWHDAGDQLKYLITGSYATAHMLMAYKLYPNSFADKADAFGRPEPNGIPDVLDEAKWGLDWILKLHTAPDQLIHQVADDRDHRGWKYPYDDNSDYGWGPNSYRVAYFATGKPQGLNKHKSKATGVANLAGRSAAAMALAARIWKEDLDDPVFASRCRQAAATLYQLGREKEGFQQGNSYGAPYRYNERTWADDMEWGAAELYKTTGERRYLEEAVYYARMANSESWIGQDKIEHYEYYPFVNLGHYALSEVADADLKKTLAGYYREGIVKTLEASKSNTYNIGVPFIWCSNNLLTSLITQIVLYEDMTADKTYHNFMIKQRDWLFGRNPWGTSMFTGLPENGDYPVDVHTSTWIMTGKEVAGGLVDGPVYASVYNSLAGLKLERPDEYQAFQNDHVVYHDDNGDYSTNEPTMDGTAGSILMFASWASGQK